MSTQPRTAGQALNLETTAARVGRTVLSSQTFAAALVANAAALDNLGARFLLSDPAVDSGTGTATYRVRWPVSAQAGYLWICWVGGPQDTPPWWSHTAAVALTVRDSAGTTVTTAPPLPVWSDFTGGAQAAPGGASINRFTTGTPHEGCLDVAALRTAGLTGSDWELELAITHVGNGTVQRIEGWELPRFLLDDSVATGGVLPGAFNPDEPITTANLGQLLATIETARTTQRTYLALAWPLILDATLVPRLTSDVDGPFAILQEPDGLGGYVAAPWTVPVRRVYAAAALGEAVRWRVLYRMSGGAASCQVRLATGSSASPFDTGSLAYTTTWTWTPWLTGAYLASNGTGTRDTIRLSGWREAADGTGLWLGGVCVQGNNA